MQNTHTHTHTLLVYDCDLERLDLLSVSAAFHSHGWRRRGGRDFEVRLSSSVILPSLLRASGPWKNAKTNLHELHPHLLCTMTLHASAPSRLGSVLALTARFVFFSPPPPPPPHIGLAVKGGNARMAQFFRGNLAGLMIRSGKLENKRVIDCLYTCKEGLDVQLPEEVASAVKVGREQVVETRKSLPKPGQSIWRPTPNSLLRWSSIPASRL